MAVEQGNLISPKIQRKSLQRRGWVPIVRALAEQADLTIRLKSGLAKFVKTE